VSGYATHFDKVSRAVTRPLTQQLLAATLAAARVIAQGGCEAGVFERVRSKLIKDYENKPFAQAYLQSFVLKEELTDAPNFTPAERLAAVREATAVGLAAFAAAFLNSCLVSAMVMGWVDEERARAVTSRGWERGGDGLTSQCSLRFPAAARPRCRGGSILWLGKRRWPFGKIKI
jgi:secreted Zn-dependent insulinase-like peptidase